MSVTTQWQQRPGRDKRWAYVIHTEGEHPFVSGYRYRSEASALSAGKADEVEAIRLRTCEVCGDRGVHRCGPGSEHVYCNEHMPGWKELGPLLEAAAYEEIQQSKGLLS